MPGLTERPMREIQECPSVAPEAMPKSATKKRHRYWAARKSRIVRTDSTKPTSAQKSKGRLTTPKNKKNVPEVSSRTPGARSELPDIGSPRHAPPKTKELERYSVRDKLRSKLDGLDKEKSVSSTTSPLKAENVCQVKGNEKDQESKVIPLIDNHSTVTQPRYLDPQNELTPENPAICEEQVRNVPDLAETIKTKPVPLLAEGEPPTAKCQKPEPKRGKTLFTYKGGVISKSQWRKLKAKGRVSNSESEGVLALTSKFVDSSQNQLSCLPSIGTHQSLGEDPLTSLICSGNTSVPPTRELHNASMSTKSNNVRGRSYMRHSSSQVLPDGTDLVFHVSPASSTACSRRNRGFQPSEVNKGKQDSKYDEEPSVELPSKIASTEAEVSAGSQMSMMTVPNASTIAKAWGPANDPISHLEPQQHKAFNPHSQVRFQNDSGSLPEAQLFNDKFIDHKSSAPGQLTPMAMSPYGHDAAGTETALKSNVSEDSSGRKVAQDRQPSCWSKAAPTTTATPGWDNGTTDLDTPSWMLRDAQLAEIPNAPKRAVLANLSEYRFPGSGKKKQATRKADTGGSFDRQVASRGRSEVSPVLRQVASSLSEWDMNQMQNLQGKAQAQVLSNEHAIRSGNSTNLERTLTERQTGEPVVQAKHKSKTGFSPPTAPDSRHEYTAKADANLAPGAEKTPPHLRISANPSNAESQTETITNDLISKPTTLAMQDDTLPPHYCQGTGNSGAITVSEPQENANGSQLKEVTADKIPAALCMPEERVDVAVVASVSGDKAQPTESGIYEVRQKVTETDQFVPPHLRSKYFDSSPASEVKISSKEAKSEIDHSPASKLISGNITHHDVVKDFTQPKHDGLASVSYNGGASAYDSESAVKAGKQPVADGHAFRHESGLVGWDGKMIAPPIGDDWDYRQRYDTSGCERFSVIEAWREDQATNSGGITLSLDTNSPDFQTGSVLAGGMQTFMSPINEVHHGIIPNDDDFTQAHREQNAAGILEAMKTKSSVDSASPKVKKDKMRTKKEQMTFLKEQDNGGVILPNPHAPKANIYLRPAEHKDMRQCADIYNYYVEKTDCAPEFNAVDELHWRDRLQEAHDEGNPFIVAIHMNKKREKDVRNIRRKKRESVVGFAAATDYGLPRTCYRFTKEMDLWVHKDHVRQGIGRTMLDRMLAAMDPGYHLLGCVPFLGDYILDRWIGGGHCITKAIVINILHSDAEKVDVEWKTKWLSGDRINFQQAGYLPNIGHNQNKKPVNICQMLLQTVSTV